ncbi:hypothetical protein A11A3_08720 [Alcanivorax hongdengensis A-11-3]|uniref:Prepilin-type N-terminal cleavage/methylation domain-containing protein n=1 Tax=Alcanivorax hongdengensis A-11-3 TaxID=1177179 RepID=L0WC23_9GAMM|nr:PilW family protein [Alcanivorax hongdengensis]EKF74491.1 hypothetical protein A11A3_08720 [Alcanivorax hongdengensis A-11-3]
MKASQTGFSLVELMVALVLGLMVTAVAIQLFSTNQQTFAIQQTESQLQQDSQLVTRFMVRDLRRAGLVLDGVAASEDMGIKFSTGSAGFAGSADADSGDNDRLTLAFNGRTDCAGSVSTQTNGEEITNTYFIKDNGSGDALYCKGSVDDETVELVEGVESFQVEYGIDDGVNQTLQVSKYVTATNVGANDAVVAVRVGLLLHRANNSLPVSDGSRKFYVLDKTVTEPADRAMRRLVMTTIKLRNVNWDDI